MKESALLGDLFPSHPEIIPIIRDIREKYQLTEVDLDGERMKKATEKAVASFKTYSGFGQFILSNNL